MTAVAAGKQPERPSPAKEASSATGGEPPKPTCTNSYTGATPAPPSEVRACFGLAQTAQSSRTFSKTGNAAAKMAVPQTNAQPANQADTTMDLDFQVIEPPGPSWTRSRNFGLRRSWVEQGWPSRTEVQGTAIRWQRCPGPQPNRREENSWRSRHQSRLSSTIFTDN